MFFIFQGTCRRVEFSFTAHRRLIAAMWFVKVPLHKNFGGSVEGWFSSSFQRKSCFVSCEELEKSMEVVEAQAKTFGRYHFPVTQNPSTDNPFLTSRCTPLKTCGRKYCTLLPTHRFSGKSFIFAWWFPVLWSKCSTSILVYSHALRQTHWDSYSGCRALGWEISSGRKTSQLGPIQLRLDRG